MIVDPLNVLDAVPNTENQALDANIADIVAELKDSEQSDNEVEQEVKPISALEHNSENYHTEFDENIDFDDDILTNIKQDEDDDENEDYNEEDEISENDLPGKKLETQTVQPFAVWLYVIFYDILKGTRPRIPEVYVAPEKRQELLQEFDTTCDICSIELGSLKKSITHYRKCHKIDGYIKCCGLKFKQDAHIEDHIKLHVRPDMFQ